MVAIASLQSENSPDGEAIEAAVAALRDAAASTAYAVEVLGRLMPHGGVERATGLPAELVLALAAGQPSWEARALTQAAVTLRMMPRTSAAFASGALSWPVVRSICAEARSLDAAARERLDGVVAGEVTAGVEPDALLERVADTIARWRQDLVQAREDRQITTGALWLQPRLDGQGGRVVGHADAEAFAIICEAVDIAACRPTDLDAVDAFGRGGQRLDGLVAVCEAFLSGTSTGGRPRPRFLVSMDLRDLAAGEDPLARLLWRAPGAPARLSLAATQTLLCDAEILPIVYDRARPISVGDIEADPSPRARAAVISRDGGCRFPGCRMPAAWGDIHHLEGRRPGATTSIDDLALFCRRCHLRIHRQRWKVTMGPGAVITVRRHGKIYTSHPRIRGPARE